ncbi:hypothetical protein BX265_4092 [Streptomyces sp. TLI_235]|nr:hypothetical protein [Streptomyces sp. TLI_235]PBC79290.1 hypothetical protein BX265_4092 [Streptomyces sp. TLI_235]
MTTAVADGRDVDRADLSLDGIVGAGGQGRIHRLHGGADLLYKEYLEPSRVQGAALADLVELRRGLDETERGALDARSAWPLARVLEGGRCTGFLMRTAPESMRWQTGAGSRKLIELQYLLHPERPATAGVVGPAPAQRLALGRAIVDLLAGRHRHGLVVGNLSQANILWTVVPEPEVFLIDCDGIRRAGARPVLEQAETPDWGDPLSPFGSDATVDSDRYKAALAVGRVLAQNAYLAPGTPLVPLPGVLNDRQDAAVRRLWQQAAGPFGTRPELRAWSAALDERGVIPVPRLRPAPPRPVDTSLFGNRRGPRGSIPTPPTS